MGNIETIAYSFQRTEGIVGDYEGDPVAPLEDDGSRSKALSTSHK